jgi:multiple sugar transport system permease protein
MTIKQWGRTLATTLILILYLLWTVVPIGLVVSNSFKSQMDIFSVPPTILFQPTLDNYIRAVTSGDFGRYFWNSFCIGAISSILSVGLGALTAYSLVSLKPRYASLIANMFLVGKLVPAITMLLPLFALLNLTRLLGTYVGPVLAHTAVNLPFVIWLIMGFIRDLPKDLEAAAKADGCTPMQTFWFIIVPVIAPGLAAATILSLQFSWNELIFSLQLTNIDTYTLPVGISKFVGSISVDWGKSSAAASITMIPMILFGFVVQKYLAKGTIGGAVKG